MSHFPFQSRDSIEVLTKAVFSGLLSKSNESRSEIADSEGKTKAPAEPRGRTMRPSGAGAENADDSVMRD